MASSVAKFFGMAAEQDYSLNMNHYATKKTMAQGMMNLCLFSTNLTQLMQAVRMQAVAAVREGVEEDPFYPFVVSLIIISMILQVC